MLTERQGLHPRVLQPLRGMYRELRRKFVMAGHARKEFVASNGVIQGCPLSVLLLNLLMNTWARSVKAGTTTAMLEVSADDAGVLSENSRDTDIGITGRFATVKQQKLNFDKTKVWAPPKLRLKQQQQRRQPTTNATQQNTTQHNTT